MKSIVKKAFSVSAAAVMISSFAVQAGAVTVETPGTKEYQFNKPYLNINVDGGNIDFSEIDFSLKNSDGEIVAKWDGDAEKFTEVADGLYDISDAADYEKSDWEKLPWDNFDRSEIEKENPFGDFYENYNRYSSINSKYTSDYIYPADKCSYLYFEDQYVTGKTMTVSANTIILDASEEYKTNGDDYSQFKLGSLGDVSFCDYAGQIHNFPVDAGEFEFWLGIKNHGAGYAGIKATSCSDPQEYVQLKLDMRNILSSCINDDLEFVVTRNDEEKRYPANGDKSGDNKVAYAFVSGSVISAPIPDDDGNVYVWVNKFNPYLSAQTDYYSANGWSGGGSAYGISLPKSRIDINAKFELPESGLTLYNIPSGDYTVEIDSTEYALENNTITVTDTKDMQSMNIVLKDFGDSSSESSSETSSTSSEASSSEASSSDTSSAQSSSEVSSSQASSSTNTSSVTNSKASSNAASTGNTANNSNNTPNPATGAAAGFTGIALIAGAAIVVSKKSRK